LQYYNSGPRIKYDGCLCFKDSHRILKILFLALVDIRREIEDSISLNALLE